jgi:pimeloyl-ACP methyl ester carboxylesterase
MTDKLQSLSDIEERIELLKTTLGLFAPEEPAPIAAELQLLVEEMLMHWLHSKRVSLPTGRSAQLPTLLQWVRQHDPGFQHITSPVGELLRLHAAIAQEPDHPETSDRLVAAATAAGEIYSFVAPRIAASMGPSSLASIVAAICVLASLLLATPLRAEEISTRFRGLTLMGNLELAEGRGLEDGVGLIVHGMLAHDRMEIIAALQKDLTTRGISTLAITLSLGQDQRTGFFDCGRLHAHRPFDALDEIDAWIGWLKNNGAADIVLIGHSQGGNQVAVYGAERRDASVSALVLLAPATFDFSRVAENYQARYDAELPPLLDKAQALVQTGQAVEPLVGVGFLNCPNATVTAGSFAGWYAPSPLRHTPSVLPRVPVRTLVIVAGSDEMVPDLGPAVKPLARPASRGKGEIVVRAVERADHFFRDIYIDDAADIIAEWLRG